MRFFVHCRRLRREGVGELHIHRRWWGRREQALLHPEGSACLVAVPHEALCDVVAARTPGEAWDALLDAEGRR